uniref:Uncharacterized protein n=1 Tax=Glossina pallidipes TaxID=7398 RepID=A0A1B0A6S6_GLOPL
MSDLVDRLTVLRQKTAQEISEQVADITRKRSNKPPAIQGERLASTSSVGSAIDGTGTKVEGHQKEAYKRKGAHLLFGETFINFLQELIGFPAIGVRESQQQ